MENSDTVIPLLVAHKWQNNYISKSYASSVSCSCSRRVRACLQVIVGITEEPSTLLCVEAQSKGDMSSSLWRRCLLYSVVEFMWTDCSMLSYLRCNRSVNTRIFLLAFHVYYPLRFVKLLMVISKLNSFIRCYYSIILRKGIWWTLGGGLRVWEG